MAIPAKAQKLGSWITNVIIWGVFIYLIYLAVTDKKIEFTVYIILGFAYVMHFIFMFNGEVFSYVCHISQGNAIYTKMGELFKTAPIIEFTSESYHYSYYTHRASPPRKGGHRTGGGHRAGGVHHGHTRTTRTRVVTYRDRYSLPYCSTRDVSGLFLLDTQNAGTKNFIQLELKKCIDFADSISYSDYIKAKNEFWQRNRYRDLYMEYHENRDIPGFNEHELVQLRDGCNCCLGGFFYIFWTILSLGKIYECYVNSLCHTQSYKIRKLISTRYNLLQPKYVEQYMPLTPAIKLPDTDYTYNPEDVGCAFNSADINPPSESELQQAEMYESYVPNYNVTGVQSVGGNLQVGVVQDLAEFENVNYDAAPPGFVSGDVELQQGSMTNQAPMNQEMNEQNGSQPMIVGQNQNNMYPYPQNQQSYPQYQYYAQNQMNQRGSGDLVLKDNEQKDLIENSSEKN